MSGLNKEKRTGGGAGELKTTISLSIKDLPNVNYETNNMKLIYHARCPHDPNNNQSIKLNTNTGTSSLLWREALYPFHNGLQ